MTTRMNRALRLCLTSSALGGLIAFAFAPAATAQWLPPWRAASPGEIERSLEAQGYGLIAPLVRRPGIYLADVSAGPAGYQRLVVDARSGQILERFMASRSSLGTSVRRPRRRVWRAAAARRGKPWLLRPPSNGAGGEEILRRSCERPYSGGHQPIWRRGSAGRNEAQGEVGFHRTRGGDDQAPVKPASTASRATRGGLASDKVGHARIDRINRKSTPVRLRSTTSRRPRRTRLKARPQRPATNRR